MSLDRRSWLSSAALNAVALASFGLPLPKAWAQASASAFGGRSRGVVMCISLEPDSLDPTMAASASVAQVVHYNVLEGLMKIGENGATSGLLAESWSVEPDGKTYTFRLRKGVRFHDGSPCNAEAVKFSFERAKAPGSTNKARKSLFDNISHIAAPDEHTVILMLHNPDGNTLFRLGESPAVILHPLSAAQAATQPVGTGPFRVDQWKKGWGILLSRWSGFRHAAQVSMDWATYRFIADPPAQAAAVLNGDVDVLFNFATQQVSQFVGNNRYQVLIGASGGKGMLAINNRRPPLGDIRVRRAISHAIDRERFIREVLDGRGKAIGSHFSPTDAGYVHLAGVYPYDPDKARALLKEAGVVAPLELKLALPPTLYARTGGPVIVEELARVGIQVQPEQVEWAQWLAGPFKGQFDLTLINHVEPLDYQIYTDPQYYFGYDSPVFRDLVQRHAASINARERQLLFAQMQRQLTHDAVNAWIFAPQISTVARKGLKGLWMNYPVFVHDLAALRWEG